MTGKSFSSASRSQTVRAEDSRPSTEIGPEPKIVAAKPSVTSVWSRKAGAFGRNPVPR
jgi:hypothetical protein